VRRALLVLWLVAAATTKLPAQEPTVSSALGRADAADTVVRVWLFGRTGRTIDAVADAVRQLGGTVRHRSRWLHAVSADLPSGSLRLVRSRSELRHVQPVARLGRRPEPWAPAAAPLAAPGAGAGLDSVYGPSAMPLRQLGLFPLPARNIRGGGVKIAILDTGFETGDPAFASTLVLAQRDFVFGDTVVANEPNDDPSASRHGTEVWSLLAAEVPGNIIGLAPDAGYVLAKTEDVRSETRVEEDNWVAALEWVDSLGVTVVSSSVGYVGFDDGFTYRPQDFNGDVAVTTVAADSAAARGIAIVNAAGNEGPAYRSLITPADGHLVIAAGAEDSLGALASFSSRGPTADGRLKPDLTAPGVGVFVVNPSAGGFARANGTSFAAPLLAGTVALLRELHPTYTPAEIRSALRRYATRALAPDSSSGWGRPNGAMSAFFPQGVVLTGPTDTMLPSVSPTFSWTVPELPLAALPVRYRLVVATDTLFTSVVLDTMLIEENVTLPPHRPGDRLAYRVTARTTDSLEVTSAPSPRYVTPAWVTLLEPDAPGGVTLRELRPTFRWASPEVTVPPGPFVYDLRIMRVDDGALELEALDLDATEFVPTRDLERNTPYRWSVTARLGTDSLTTESGGTFVIVDDSAPLATLLYQNFPNPFPNRDLGRDATCIWFDLASPARVRLDILDARGHVMREIVPGTEFPGDLPAGRYGRSANGTPGSCDPRFEWNGTAPDGSALPQGIYIVRLVTPDATFTKRIVYMGRDY
jgi:hypothetical protein